MREIFFYFRLCCDQHITYLRKCLCFSNLGSLKDNMVDGGICSVIKERIYIRSERGTRCLCLIIKTLALPQSPLHLLLFVLSFCACADFVEFR